MALERRGHGRYGRIRAAVIACATLPKRLLEVLMAMREAACAFFLNGVPSGP